MPFRARNLLPALFASVLGALAASPALASGEHEGGHHEEQAQGHHHEMTFGKPAKPEEAERTVSVVLTDTAFSKKEIEVEAGETVRFKLRNEGSLVHEFSIATPHLHKEHQDKMMGMMQAGKLTTTEVKTGTEGQAMGHEHANSVLLEPGESGSLTWTFAEAKKLQFACNVPGHYQQGMKGPIHVHGEG